jgi:hypothetical protein
VLLDFSQGNMNKFADHIYNFDNVMGLEAWHLKMLLRCKEDLDEELERLEAIEEEKEEEKKRRAEERAAAFVSAYSPK